MQRLGEDENFWPANAPSQGPDGVCGPCSEIYFHTPFGSVEIWNLVFTQFNRVGDPPDNLSPLPSKNIDTGMGLERTASVLQGVETNFHIDILGPLVEAAGEVCGVRYQPAEETGRRLRRIADHVRACTFAVHENVYPGNKKQGYVIRRLLRRAVLDGHQMGVHEPFLHKLVDKVAELMKNPYPELTETTKAVARVIEAEEANFLATLDAGLDRIERIFSQMKSEHRGMVSGAEAADMFQTHGFPPELFETLAAERNLAFDWKGFQAEMEQHGIESGGGQKIEVFRHDPLAGLKKTVHGSQFLGYETLEVADARVIGIIANDQLCDQVSEIDHDNPIAVVLDRTPVLRRDGRAGGRHRPARRAGHAVRGHRLADRRRLHAAPRPSARRPTHARHDGGRPGRRPRRQAIRRAHTATHLLHFALQKHVGKHALQQGSKVDEDWLRFDFANPSALSEDQLLRVENEVNERILAAAPVGCADLPLAEARKLGAMMLFGEKYPDVVRVVSVGDFSKELCGGTHLANSAEAGIFKIVGEESVAAGTRRITALTGRGVLEQVRKVQTALARAAGDAQSPARRAARAHRGNGQGDAAAPQAGCRRTQGRADGSSSSSPAPPRLAA